MGAGCEALARVGFAWLSHEAHLQEAAASWRCASCESQAKPTRTKASQPAPTYEFNDIVGLDVIFLPDHSGKKQPHLNMVDWVGELADRGSGAELDLAGSA